ncbi:MAG: IS66 family transposase, partial [Gammaproteobacteria bacterium]
VYTKPAARGRKRRPGRKRGHPGARRRTPEHIDHHEEHSLSHCPHCDQRLGKPIRQHTRLIEDIPPVTPTVTEHTIHGYWCGTCRKIVTAPVSDALPHSTLGLRLLVYTAWLHYAVGVSVGNCVKIAAASLGFTVSPGGLTQGWKSLARHLEGGYEDILQKIRTSAVLHADETGWRVNGVTHWLWAFATRLHCYYLIDRHRSTRVVQAVLGTVFPGILITDFWSAYHALQALAKQKCYFHLFTELVKVDKLSTGPPWQGFRKKLARLLRDAVRLGQAREKLPAKHYERRKARLHRRLDELIAAPWKDRHAQRLVKRLRRHRQELFTFLDHADVSPYNNHAEQQMRVAVHTRKVSQQNRSQMGAQTHAILLSHFRTAQLQKLNPIDHVMQLARSALVTQHALRAAEPIHKAA